MICRISGHVDGKPVIYIFVTLYSVTMFCIHCNYVLYTFFKEAGYSKVPEIISLHFSGFPILAFMRIPFINFRGSLTSKVSVSRFCNIPYLPLWQLNFRKLSS